ncbi:MAG: hypothetical protein A2655_03875 [Candidatus Yanofskybacteria bacterium RIFCSPHIGHO2_01_FULL_43_42]|uniref:Uncharacterized protein n=1 Tax=Candidatus Yanofskybacteria bacterium RIFCSPLOWO2_01_FULL_43_22 TaxID=1802695 RepID=A0A1F8GI33_9BACT|nr:MAG: hypothetical protein A2655_03875 [Candidatus Yanofskybacteria bacterium RIFCSPHIGHO2_01_FULL_43_42]OGN25055.1 MAG: hypothetical protein A3A13_03310 [Candidatus Yanofskybacteria bacterium RIFCSPLOWO2_01_FULL_43_22]
MSSSNNIVKEIKTITILGLALFFVWTAYDNSIYFSFFNPPSAEAATGSGTATVEVTIASNLTFSIIGTCNNDNTCDNNASASFGTITAGTANDSNVQVKSVSNDTITLAIGRRRASPATTLASSADAANINISDTAGGIDVFDSDCTDATSPATWGNGSSTGLGFSVWAASVNKNTTCFGSGTTDSDANNKYAALQASASANSAWTTTAAGTQYASAGFTLDVTTTQQATTYSGGVIFTATTTP